MKTGNEELVTYIPIPLSGQRADISPSALSSHLLSGYGEAVLLEGQCSVSDAYGFYAELADKAMEIAYRESPTSPLFVIRSFLPTNYIHLAGTILAETLWRDARVPKNRGHKKPVAEKDEALRIDLEKLWTKEDSALMDTEPSSAVRSFFSHLGAITDGTKVMITGEIPLAPALYALDYFWSGGTEVYYGETRLK